MKPLFLLPLLVLAACSELPRLNAPSSEPAAGGAEATRPQARPAAPPAGARTAEAYDTTTAEERAEASAPQAAGERLLGRSVASLGDPARPGFWVETPLVSAPTQGRVVAPGGKSARVELIPIEGPASGGSRLSLAAMRLIGVPLTDLPTVEIYSGG
ncbi:hypothetical protein [Salipiger abyssi]|uniref:hypothetical protein n=1 Tax=Salipiger abyssi TaxID=1250539 RepID=UPI0009761F75|nr:hypothetical protein [Salipiger abyssi]